MLSLLDSMFFSRKENQGFTLIELLVVIAIIGIIASIAIVSLSGSRSKSRDTARLAQMNQLNKAILAYHAEKGQYPSTVCPTNHWTSFDSASYSAGVVCDSPNGTNLGTLPTALSSYIKPFKDPSGDNGGDRGYLYISNDSQSYCILLFRTPEDMRNYPATMVPANRCGTMDANGQCSGTNAAYIGVGTYVNGC